jgi:hypothetical protein
MPGHWITDQQYRFYMTQRNNGFSQACATAKAGFSERTARRFRQAGMPPSGCRRPRTYRTREDPLAAVWDEDLLPLLDACPDLQATSLLSELQRRYPDAYPDTLLRTVQRRLAHWRAVYGPERDLIFRQEHPPGHQGLSDFTDGGKLGVTLAGLPFAHLLYHFRLAYSGWEHAKAIIGGESYPALAEGLQEALWQLGGAPSEHRTDRLSAAYRNLDRDAQADAAEAYHELCRHYRMRPTRNNPGLAHENGAIEGAHGGLRRRLADALALRGSSDFDDLAAYQGFVQEVVSRANRRRRKAVDIELTALKPLPARRTCDFTPASVTVTTSGTVRIRGVLYSVPSRLVGCRLKAHIYDDRIVCYLGTSEVVTLSRLRAADHNDRPRRIDYRHVIASLVHKPQAFRRYVFRENMFPTPAFRAAWQAIDRALEPRHACRVYVGLLHLAAWHDCEADLAQALETILGNDQLPDLDRLRQRFIPKPPTVEVQVAPPDVTVYDSLLSAAAAAEAAP